MRVGAAGHGEAERCPKPIAGPAAVFEIVTRGSTSRRSLPFLLPRDCGVWERSVKPDVLPHELLPERAAVRRTSVNATAIQWDQI